MDLGGDKGGEVRPIVGVVGGHDENLEGHLWGCCADELRRREKKKIGRQRAGQSEGRTALEAQ